jgi:hypothetical protein
MIARYLKPFVFLVAVLLLSVQARSQLAPMETVESIDVQLVRSRSVSIGTVEDFTHEPRVEERQVAFAVRESLFGPPAPRRRGMVLTSIENLEAWKTRSARMLLFERTDKPWLTAIDLDDPNLVMWTEEFGMITKGDEVIRYLRRILRKPRPPSAETFELYPPEGRRGDKWRRWAKNRYVRNLVVPVDERLEKRAIEYLAARSPHLRVHGVRALRLFKSDRNVERLRALLDDPGFQIDQVPERNRGIEARTYPVREAVYDVLHNYWGVPVPEPIRYERISRLSTIETLQVDLWNKEMESDWLKGAKQVKSVTLYALNGLSDSQLAAIRSLTTLESLTAHNVGLTDAQLKTFRGLRNLRTLDIASNPITDASLEEIEAFPKLREVVLTQTEVTDEGLARLRRRRPGLRVTPAVAVSRIHELIAADDLVGVARVLDRNSRDLDQRDPSGNTPLHNSVSARRYGIARLLLERGAQVDAVNKQQETPLSQLMHDYQPDLAMIRILLGHGADPNKSNPLQVALNSGSVYNLDAIRVLLTAGANPANLRNLTEIAGKSEGGRRAVSLVSEWLRMRREAPAYLRQTSADCNRTVYRLSAPDFANWSSKELGPINGPLQWSRSPSGRDFLGPFGQQSTILRLASLPKHRYVTVEVELFVIGSWDGNGGIGTGPDLIDITVPGVGTALHATFFNNAQDEDALSPMQSYPDRFPLGFHVGYTGANEVRSLGFVESVEGRQYPRDAVYRLKFTFAHDKDELEVVLTGQPTPQGYVRSLIEDERWGIGNLVVKTD